MNEQDRLATRYEQHRPRLRAVAYRMLGSFTEADDALQEAWLRMVRVDPGEVDNLGAWMTTVVARVCLNILRSRRRRPEESLDVHLADPIVDSADGIDPEHEALLADSVGLALLVVLDTLTPAASRHPRRAVRRDRPDRRPFADRCPPAREPCTPADPWSGGGTRRRPWPPARDRPGVRRSGT